MSFLTPPFDASFVGSQFRKPGAHFIFPFCVTHAYNESNRSFLLPAAVGGHFSLALLGPNLIFPQLPSQSGVLPDTLTLIQSHSNSHILHLTTDPSSSGNDAFHNRKSQQQVSRILITGGKSGPTCSAFVGTTKNQAPSELRKSADVL
jgi:hypothetical protein